MSGWWVQDAWNIGPAYLISWIFWVLFSITLHELAHGWAALSQGDGTPRELDRMTANPLVQMGTTSLIVFFVIGIAWGMMPVNPSRFRQGRVGEIIVAAAGPAMNLLLAFVSLTVLGVIVAFGPEEPGNWLRSIETFLLVGGFLNFVLFALNLLPIPPLDGSRILGATSIRIRHFYAQPQSQLLSLGLLVAIFFFGAGNFIFTSSIQLASGYTSLVARLLGADMPS
ncbi:MAG: site-2 protease family protein [Phycisphaerales bacterium]|nr:site-2 protease family protein [Phycisphaerales bacterium]